MASPEHACVCRQELSTWPQYAKCIVKGPGGRAAIHLDVFAYFAFWTAFYVLRGSQTRPPDPVMPRQGRLAYSSLAPSLGTVKKVHGLSPLLPYSIESGVLQAQPDVECMRLTHVRTWSRLRAHSRPSICISCQMYPKKRMMG